jgi:hypothetical protein
MKSTPKSISKIRQLNLEIERIQRENREGLLVKLFRQFIQGFVVVK